MSEGIYQGFQLTPGDTPWTVALDLSKRNEWIANREIAQEILIRSSAAAIIRP